MRSTLTDKKRGQVCGVLAMGGTKKAAARYVGCSMDTLRRAAKTDPEFAEDLKQAVGQVEVMQLKNITSAAAQKQDWRAAAWVLERRFPGRYKPNAKTLAAELTQIVRRLIELVVHEIDDAAVRQRVFERLSEAAEEFKPRLSKKSK